MIVFISDPSADADRALQALRHAGFGVIDVPLSMLRSRVLVQRPLAVILDGGAKEAAELTTWLVGQQGGPPILVACSGGAPDLDRERVRTFPRPLEPDAVIRFLYSECARLGISLHALGSHRSSSRPPRRVSLPPPGVELPPRRSRLPPPMPVPLDVGEDVSGRLGPSVQPPISPELDELLKEAEARVQFRDASFPDLTPEEELDAVVPEEALLALDESFEFPMDLDASSDGARITTDSGRMRRRPASEPPAPPLPRVTSPLPPPSPEILEFRLPPMPTEPPVREALSRTLDTSKDLIDLLFELVSEHRSGELVIDRDAGTARVSFESGDLVGIESDDPSDAAPFFLVAHGYLTAKRAAELRVPSARRAPSLFGALVAQGVLLAAETSRAARGYVEWLLARVLERGEATATFDPSAPVPTGDVRIDARDLIARFEEWREEQANASPSVEHENPIALLRERTEARLELAREGDYFSILGVSRSATTSDVERAYSELRGWFEAPSFEAPELTDLVEPRRVILEVLEEARAILGDADKRARYKRAISRGA